MTRWRSAFRSLTRRPAFAAAAILILALGIGATTTLFSLIDTVLWKALPYPNPDRLVTLFEANPAKNQNTSLIAPVRLEDWARLGQSFESISGSYAENVTDTSGVEPERLSGRRVAPRFFAVYGTTPAAGRVFDLSEEKFGGPRAAVISYHLWQRRYRLDPGTLGKRLILAGEGYTIVGVMPEGFAAPAIDLWMPAQLPPFVLQARDARFLSGLGRLKPGLTAGQAQAELSRVQSELGRQFPATDKGWSASVGDLKEARAGGSKASLSLMFGAVVLLLLIACANAGGLMLGQLHRRERELAIRGSLGAGRGQLVGVVMREVALLIVCGASLGLAFSIWGVQAIRAVFLNLPRVEEVRLDWRALLFTMAASLLATALVGLAPALQTLRTDLSGRLYHAARSQGRGRRMLQRGLVACQFAVTLVLLLGSGLLIRSYTKLSRVDPGFDTSRVISFHVGAEWRENRAALGGMQQRLLAELERVPGVQAAGMTNFLPATGGTLRFEAVMEGSSGDSGGGKMQLGERTIGGAYLKTLRMPFLQGGPCPELQTDFNKPAKAIVNHRFVEKYGNGAPVIGRHLGFGGSPDSEIVGVIADAKEDGLDAPAYPYAYMCLAAGSWPDPEYVVRTSGDPRQIMAAVRQVVHSVAPTRAVFGVTTLQQTIESSLNTPRLSAEVLALFGATALVLAAVGLYSLVMLAVTSQTKEIGVRVALGAGPLRIVRSVIFEAALPVFIGLAAGAALAVFALNAKPVHSMLFGVEASDALTMLSVIATLALVSILAALLPARRAIGIDPVQALRAE
ncbi:MAG: ABC transporter permease [Acidobacteriota bacterium]|nr:ABC transporter permease [Acidobacteriota bacterium]